MKIVEQSPDVPRQPVVEKAMEPKREVRRPTMKPRVKGDEGLGM